MTLWQCNPLKLRNDYVGNILIINGLSCKSPWIGANQLPKDFGYPEHEERDILYTSYLSSEALHLRVQ